MSLDSLPLQPKTSRYGCGIYNLGDEELNYIRVFATDKGRVVVLRGMLDEETLLDVYSWGRQEAIEDCTASGHVAADVPRAKRTPKVYDPDADPDVVGYADARSGKPE